MNDDRLESLLTRQGENWRAAQPAAPSLSALSPGPQTRAARAPWLVPTLVAAALLAPLLGTFALLRGNEPERAMDRVGASPAVPTAPTAPAVTVVPWSDSSSPVFLPLRPDRLATRAPAETTLPKGTQQCESGDFGSPSAVARSGYTSGLYVLTVERVGAEACAIGYVSPTVHILDASGQTLATGGDSLAIGRPGSTLLQPGDVLLVPARICGTGIASVDLWFASAPADPRMFGQREAVSVTIPFPGPSTCASGGSGNGHQEVVPAGNLSSLVQSYSVPSRVRSGQRLDYSVTLTNPSATAVSLQPCPDYRQSLIDVLKLPDKDGATRTGQLNCAAAPTSVPANGSITFQMRLDTKGVPAGERRLVWDWLGSTLTDAQGYAQFPTVTVY
ncbi:MAG TPA: hypothetical protein VGB75_15235 [Jatrophihabitans sp.]|jgi:hypothetical protein|uniref:hypothetical protein n=1 Tax=Jatrophihabitans sp. TaxID=1932789 RepID=UPI002F0643CA